MAHGRGTEGLLDFGGASSERLGALFQWIWHGMAAGFTFWVPVRIFWDCRILKRYSHEYFLREDNGWSVVSNEGIVEKAFAEAVTWFVKQTE